jgi:uncharacterized membrane protein
MTRVEDTVEVDAPSGTIWNVLTDPSYLPKLYAYILTVESDPPGRTVHGQRCSLVGRIGTRKIKIIIQFTAVDLERRLVSRHVPGALFGSFEHIVTLTPDAMRTQVKTEFEYSLSPEYVQKVPDAAMLERMVNESFRAYARNLKEICELLPLPV